MAANETIGIDLSVPLTNFKKAMAELGPESAKQGKAMAAELARALKQVQKSNEDAAKKVKSAWDAAGDGAGKMGQAGAKLAGIFDMILPGAGNVARAVNDIGDAGEVAAESGKALGLSMMQLGPIAAGLTLIIGAAAVGWHTYELEGQRAEDRTRSIQAAADELRPSMDALAQAQLRLAEAQGSISKEEADRIRGVQTATRDYTGDIAAATKATAELAPQIAKLTEERDRLKASTYEDVDATSRSSSSHATASLRISALNKELAYLTGEYDRNQAVIREAAKVYVARVEVEDQVYLATQKTTEATKASAAATKDLTTETYSYLTAADKQARENDFLLQLQDERIKKAEDEKKALKDQADAAKKAAEAAKDAARAHQELVQRGFSDAVAGIGVLEDVADQSMQAHLATMSQLQAAESAAGDNATARKKTMLKRQIAAERAHALEAFGIHKALALSSAIVSGAQAVQGALASAPPPYNYIEAGITGAAAAVEIGTIAGEKPSFARGTASAPAASSDGYLAELHPREGVATPLGVQAAGGEEAFRQLNTGMRPGGYQQAPAPLQLGHRYYNDFMQDNLRRGGPVSARIDRNRTRPWGHRAGRN